MSLINIFDTAATKQKPKRILVVTDPGRDPDDEVLFAQLSGLARLGYAKIVGIVVNQTPLIDRAVFAKATFKAFGEGKAASAFNIKAMMVKAHLKALGLKNVNVAVGTEGDVTHVLRPYEFDVPYFSLAKESDILPDGQALIKAQLEEARRAGEKVTLLLVSGMKDADIFIQANSELAKETIERVEIMGGIEIDADLKAVVDQDGLLKPDNANNNKFGNHENDDKTDPVSKYARSLYATLQKMDIPTTVITRFGAYAAQVPGTYYTDLANTGHPVGIRLRDMQRSAIVGLYEDVMQPGGHHNKRLTPEWFGNTFLIDPQNDMALLAKDTSNILDRIKGFNPYDPMTALDAFFPKLFAPYQHGKGGMQVIGLSANEPGVADVAGTHKLLNLLPRIGFGIEPHSAWKVVLARLGIEKPKLPKDLRKFR